MKILDAAKVLACLDDREVSCESDLALFAAIKARIEALPGLAEAPAVNGPEHVWLVFDKAWQPAYCSDDEGDAYAAAEDEHDGNGPIGYTRDDKSVVHALRRKLAAAEIKLFDLQRK